MNRKEIAPSQTEKIETYKAIQKRMEDILYEITFHQMNEQEIVVQYKYETVSDLLLNQKDIHQDNTILKTK